MEKSSLFSELKRTNDYKMRIFNPQLRNKNRERAIRPGCHLCSSFLWCLGQEAAQTEPNTSLALLLPSWPVFLSHSYLLLTVALQWEGKTTKLY